MILSVFAWLSSTSCCCLWVNPLGAVTTDESSGYLPITPLSVGSSPLLFASLKRLKFYIIFCLLSCVKFSLKWWETKWVELGAVGVINSFLVWPTNSSIALACKVLSVFFLYSFLRIFEFCRLVCRTLNAHFARRDFGSKINVYFDLVPEALTCTSGSSITFVACSQFSDSICVRFSWRHKIVNGENNRVESCGKEVTRNTSPETIKAHRSIWRACQIFVGLLFGSRFLPALREERSV